MSCLGRLREEHDWIVRLLAGRPAYRLTEDTLTLVAGRTSITFVDARELEPR